MIKVRAWDIHMQEMVDLSSDHWILSMYNDGTPQLLRECLHEDGYEDVEAVFMLMSPQKDSEGTDIYVGDYVSDGDVIGEVKFGNYDTEYSEGETGFYLDCGEVNYSLSACDAGVVIGNIYEVEEE